MVATGIKFDWTKRAKKLLYTEVLMLYQFVYAKVSISFIQDVSECSMSFTPKYLRLSVKLLLET